jgi:hypothetical protein
MSMSSASMEGFDARRMTSPSMYSWSERPLLAARAASSLRTSLGTCRIVMVVSVSAMPP